MQHNILHLTQSHTNEPVKHFSQTQCQLLYQSYQLCQTQCQPSKQPNHDALCTKYSNKGYYLAMLVNERHHLWTLRIHWSGLCRWYIPSGWAAGAPCSWSRDIPWRSCTTWSRSKLAKNDGSSTGLCQGRAFKSGTMSNAWNHLSIQELWFTCPVAVIPRYAGAVLRHN